MKCHRCMLFIASRIEDTRENKFVQILILHFTTLVHALSHWALWRSITLLKKDSQMGKTKTKNNTHQKSTQGIPRKLSWLIYAGEGNYLSLCTKSHQHIVTEASYGCRKLYFTSYLALYTILKIATLWKCLISASINGSWKKNLPNKNVELCKIPLTYVSWKVNTRYIEQPKKSQGFFL